MGRLAMVASLLCGCVSEFPPPPPGESFIFPPGLDAAVDARLGPEAAPPADMRTAPDVTPADARPLDAGPFDATPAPPDLAVVVDGGRAARPPASGELLISEVDYNQPDEDQLEFVELHNASPDTLELGGVRLELFSPGGQGPPAECDGEAPAAGGPFRYGCAVLPPMALPPGGLVVLTDAAALPDVPPGIPALPILGDNPRNGVIQNGPDGMRLTLPGGGALDGLAYGDPMETVGEGLAAEEDPPRGEAISLSRCPHGVDTDDNKSDFVARPISPGRPNTCD